MFHRIGRDSLFRRISGVHESRKAIGQSCEAVVDPEFDEKTSASYRPCLIEQEPMYHHFMGLVKTGKHLRWVSFERLILPKADGVISLVHQRQDVAVPLFKDAV